MLENTAEDMRMIKPLDKSVKKNCLLLLFSFYFLYLISIAIKMVYTAEMEMIVSSVNESRTTVGLGLTFYYVSYSVGQLALTFFIKKINMKWFMIGSVSLSALSFGLIPVFDSLWGLYVILFLNGFFQTGIWGGIVYFVSKYVPAQMNGFASAFLTTAFSLGTALTYGASALFVAVLDWRYTFLFFAILTAVSIIVFWLSLKMADKKLSHIQSENVVEQTSKQNPDDLQSVKLHKKSLIRLIVVLSFTLILSACVYYAFTSWFTTLLINEFSMPESYSLLLTLLLPVTMTPAPFAINKASDKLKSNYTVSLTSTVIYTVTLVALCFTYSANIVLTLVLAVLCLFFVRGMISLIYGYFPLKLKDEIDASKLSLVMNSLATLMAAAMPSLASIIFEQIGWSAFFAIMAGLGGIATIFCVYGKLSEIKRKKSADLQK